jgi:hypothetical protein
LKIKYDGSFSSSGWNKIMDNGLSDHSNSI